MANTKYQPEIDGLRALAVLAVILFHLQEKLLPSGFIGVDVFFVLSGYLITSNIYQQMSEGRFSFVDFYNRRIKRLLPSLYIILFVFSMVGVWLFVPSDLRILQNTLNKIVLFLANHYFAQGRDYFAPQTSEMPFLHTWSLAIEEQFYFTWPLLLFLMVRFGLKKNWTVVFAVVIAFASLLYADSLLLRRESTWAYYSFLGRFGELLLGAALAVSQYRTRQFPALMTALGLGMIVLSSFIFPKGTPFPGLRTLLPCVGTVFFLMASANPVRAIFAKEPLVYLGKISYQLYLWHWPILAILRYAKGSYDLSTNLILFAVFATIVASVLTHHFVEVVIRYKNWPMKKTFIRLYLVPTIVVLAVAHLGTLFPFQSQIYTRAELTSYDPKICHGRIEPSVCLKGDLGQTPKFLMTGDSHTAHLNTFIDRVGQAQHWSAFVVSAGACLPILEFDESVIDEPVARAACTQLKKYFLSNVDRYDYVGLSARWDGHFGLAEAAYDRDFEKKLLNTLDFLAKKGKTIFIFSQVPAWGMAPQRYEIVQERLPILADVPSSNPVVPAANLKLRKIVEGRPNVIFVDLYQAILDSGDVFFREGVPLRYDANHMNTYGAGVLANLVIREGKLGELGALGGLRSEWK